MLLALLPVVSRLGDDPVQPVVIRFAHLGPPEFAASAAIVVQRATRLKQRQEPAAEGAAHCAVAAE